MARRKKCADEGKHLHKSCNQEQHRSARDSQPQCQEAAIFFCVFLVQLSDCIPKHACQNLKLMYSSMFFFSAPFIFGFHLVIRFIFAAFPHGSHEIDVLAVILTPKMCTEQINNNNSICSIQRTQFRTQHRTFQSPFVNRKMRKISINHSWLQRINNSLIECMPAIGFGWTVPEPKFHFGAMTHSHPVVN